MVNADAITHELLSPNTALGQQIVDLFGKNVLRNGEFDRRAIGEIAFKDPETLHELERLLHPAVLRKIEEFYQQAQKQGGYSLFIVEIPLLYEIGQEDFYDAVIAVLSSEKNAKQRFKQAGFSDISLAENSDMYPHSLWRCLHVLRSLFVFIHFMLV